MRLLWSFLRGMALLIAGAVAQLVLSFIGLIGLVPALRAPARWVQRRLVGSVGDSFAYLYDAATWARIQQRLVERVAAASGEADQGRRRDPFPGDGGDASSARLRFDAGPRDCMGFARLGSAEADGVAAPEHQSPRRVGGVAHCGARPLSRVDPFVGVRSESGHRRGRALANCGLRVPGAIVVLCAPYPGLRKVKAAVERQVMAPLPAYALRWLDLYSFHDPVPGGPMPGSDGPAPDGDSRAARCSTKAPSRAITAFTPATSSRSSSHSTTCSLRLPSIPSSPDTTPSAAHGECGPLAAPGLDDLRRTRPGDTDRPTRALADRRGGHPGNDLAEHGRAYRRLGALESHRHVTGGDPAAASRPPCKPPWGPSPPGPLRHSSPSPSPRSGLIWTRLVDYCASPQRGAAVSPWSSPHW